MDRHYDFTATDKHGQFHGAHSWELLAASLAVANEDIVIDLRDNILLPSAGR